MSKFRKIVFYLMIPIVVICLMEGMAYYSSNGVTGMANILCTLDNTYKVFIARPTISSYNAFRQIDGTYSYYDKIVAYIYAAIVFIAPILATTAIIAGFKAYIYDFWHSIKISFKEKMLIIGDGDMTGTIASKYGKKYDVYYLMQEGTTDEDRVPLLQKKVHACTVNYSNMARVCKDAKIQKAKYIILNFSNWLESYRTVTEIFDYLIRESDDDGGAHVFMVDAPTAFVDVFDKMYKGLCKRNERDDSVLKVSFINVSEMNARAFFKNPKFTNPTGGYHHIVLTGLGTYGRSMLKELFRYMMENHMSGMIEVIDKNAGYNMNDLIFSTSSLSAQSMFTHAETEHSAIYSVKAEHEGTEVKLNFYQATIGDLKYANLLNEIVDRGNVSEYLLCIKDITVSLDCYRMIESYGETMKDVKVYFRVEEEFATSFDAIRESSSFIDYLPDGFPDIDLIDRLKSK